MSRLNGTPTKGEKDEHSTQKIEWLAAIGASASTTTRGLAARARS
jgi:hypothetical protein